MNTSKSFKSRFLPTLAGIALTLNNSAHAEVIVYFEQDGPDVTASWTGSIDLGHWFTDGSFRRTASAAGTLALFQIVGASPVETYRGLPSPTSLSNPTDAPEGGIALSFGFGDDHLFIPGVIDSAPPTFSVFDFNPSTHLIRFTGETLVEMRAESFNNTLAWTSSTGDTIRYTTGPVPVPTAVPEPSSALLGFLLLGTPCLLSRRR